MCLKFSLFIIIILFFAEINSIFLKKVIHSLQLELFHRGIGNNIGIDSGFLRRRRI